MGSLGHFFPKMGMGIVYKKTGHFAGNHRHEQCSDVSGKMPVIIQNVGNIRRVIWVVLGNFPLKWLAMASNVDEICRVHFTKTVTTRTLL